MGGGFTIFGARGPLGFCCGLFSTELSAAAAFCVSSVGFNLSLASGGPNSSLSRGIEEDKKERSCFGNFGFAGVAVSDSEELPGNPGVGLSTRLT